MFGNTSGTENRLQFNLKVGFISGVGSKKDSFGEALDRFKRYYRIFFRAVIQSSKKKIRLDDVCFGSGGWHELLTSDFLIKASVTETQ
jgi:hypothetical protein